MTLADRLSLYIASRYSDAAVSNVNFLVSGFESDIYAVRLEFPHASRKDYILRLFTGKGATSKLRREAKALSLLQTAGYPVPALLLQETNPRVLGKPFEMIEKLEGQALWPVLASAAPHQQRTLLARFGSLLAQLHRLDWRSFAGNPDPYEKHPMRLLNKIISHYRSLYEKYGLQGFLQIVDWLDQHKREISVRPAVVHQDFHANNVFLGSDDQWFVIDWTQFDISDYRIDVAWTLLIMGDLGNADWGKQILHAYTLDGNHPIEDLDYFNVLVSMKLLASTLIAWRFSPEELGLRPEAVQLTKGQVSIYRQLSQRIRTIAGLTVPEVEDMFERM